MFQSWEITIYQICIRQFLIMIIFIMSIAKIKNKWFIKKSTLYLNRVIFLWINITISSLNHMQLSCTSKRRVRCALYNNQDHGTLFKTLRDFQMNKCNSNHCSPRSISPELGTWDGKRFRLSTGPIDWHSKFLHCNHIQRKSMFRPCDRWHCMCPYKNLHQDRICLGDHLSNHPKWMEVRSTRILLHWCRFQFSLAGLCSLQCRTIHQWNIEIQRQRNQSTRTPKRRRWSTLEDSSFNAHKAVIFQIMKLEVWYSVTPTYLTKLAGQKRTLLLA